MNLPHPSNTRLLFTPHVRKWCSTGLEPACRTEPSNACWAKRAWSGSAATSSAAVCLLLIVGSFYVYAQLTSDLVYEAVHKQAQKLASSIILEKHI